MLPQKLRVLLFQEDGWWVAASLEHFVAAQGKTPQGALAAFEETLLSMFLLALEDGSDPFEDLDQAPESYWKRYREAELRIQPLLPESISVAPGLPSARALYDDVRLAA